MNYNDEEASPNLAGQTHCYLDSTDFCETFGRLYSWAAAMDIAPTYNTAKTPEGTIQEVHQGICPAGFHVPTSDEWNTLFDYVDAHNGSENVGTSLKSQYLWYPKDSVVQGTDQFGFAALPADDYVAGQKNPVTGVATGFDNYVYRNTQIWSSTESDAVKSVLTGLSNEWDKVFHSAESKLVYTSVRCIMDKKL